MNLYLVAAVVGLAILGVIIAACVGAFKPEEELDRSQGITF